MNDIANKIARQLYAMSAKKKEPDLVQTMRNEKYQRTMTDELPRLKLPPHEPVVKCNVFVSADHPKYSAVHKRAKEEPGVCKADPYRAGLWVPLLWLDSIHWQAAE